MLASHFYRDRIGNYELLDGLGEGGMAQLYLGLHIEDGHKAAIKILHSEIADDESFRKRFINEARAIASIHDPCVVKLYECGETRDGNIFLAMEYIQGETLEDRLIASGELPVHGALSIAEQIAGALSAVHAVGITHRDLKPSNVMLVDDNGETKARLLDFGIAKFLNQTGPERRLTLPGTILGTPSYMAPEQCSFSSHIDHRADIYSLGVLLYQMLAGRLPFTEREPAKLIAKHLKATPVSLRLFRPEVSERVEDAVMRCLAKRPVDRFQTADDLRKALDQARSGRARSSYAPDASWSVDPEFEEATTSVNRPAVQKRMKVEADPELLIPTTLVPALTANRPRSAAAAGPPSVAKRKARRPVSTPGLAGWPRAATASPGYERASSPAEVERLASITPIWPTGVVQALCEPPPTLHHQEDNCRYPRFTDDLGARGRLRARSTIVLPYDSTLSAFEPARNPSRIWGVTALPLLAVTLMVGFALSGWHESIPAFIDELHEISAIAGIECQGHQAFQRDEATPGTLESAVDGTPVNALVAVAEPAIAPDATGGDTASESAGPGDAGNSGDSDDMVETAKGVAKGAVGPAKGAVGPAKGAVGPAKGTVRPAKGAARKAKSAARSARNRRAHQRARRAAKRRVRQIRPAKMEVPQQALSSSSLLPLEEEEQEQQQQEQQQQEQQQDDDTPVF